MKFKKLFSYLLIMVVSNSLMNVKVYGEETYPQARVDIERIFNSELELSKEIDINDVITITQEVICFNESSNILKAPMNELMGIIPASKMVLTTAISRQSTSSKYTVVAVANWLSQPTMHMEDLFLISWGKGHTVISENLKLIYQDGATRYNQGNEASGEPNAAVGRYFETRRLIEWLPQGASVYSNVNKAIYTAVLETDGVSGSTNVYSSYAHKYLGIGSIGFDITTGGAVSFSTSLKYQFDYKNSITYFYH